jgi:chemotaxis protein CheD
MVRPTVMGMPNPKPRAMSRRLHPVEVSRTEPSSMPALDGRQSAYLLPGQLHVSAEPCQIRTILGSCVAMCLWDQWQRVGGMNHFLLPSSLEGKPTSLRFADVATRTLLEKLQRIGCHTRSLQAKIFGGSSMFQNQNRYSISLGARNIAAALDLLKRAGVTVSAQETGGTQGRKIVFNTDNGAVWSRTV